MSPFFFCFFGCVWNSLRNSHENFKKGNIPCLSLKEKKCHWTSKHWVKQSELPGAQSQNKCVKGDEGTLSYWAFHRKMLNKLRDSCQYLYKETGLGLILKHATKEKKSWETLYSIHNNNKNNTPGVGGGHSHANAMCFNTDPFLWLSGQQVLQKGGVATGYWLVAPVCLFVFQPEVLHGQAGFTKLGKTAASFVGSTIYKQPYYNTCFTFYLLGSFLAETGRTDPHAGEPCLLSTQQGENCEHRHGSGRMAASQPHSLSSAFPEPLFDGVRGEVAALFSVLLMLSSSPFWQAFKHRHLGLEGKCSNPHHWAQVLRGLC